MTKEKMQNPEILKADEYLRKHHIHELFEDLCTAVCFKQPEDVEAFLVQELKLRQQHGAKIGIFSKEEIDNVFILYDLKGQGKIPREKCREALKCLASSQYQFDNVEELKDIPERVDQPTFKKLCEKVLGLQLTKQRNKN